MKYLVVTIVVAVALWLLFRGRKADRPAARAPKGAADAQAMVQCSHCGVHLPYADSVEDRSGSYCSEAHRLAGPSAS